MRLVLATVALVALAGCAADYSGWTDRQKRDKIESMYREYHESFPDVAAISVEELLKMQEDGKVLLVDVRELSERHVSMIPGAVSVEQFESSNRQYGETAVVVYCTIGYRSGRYAETLAGKWPRVYNLRGGILAWAHAGREVVGQEGKTRRVHVYGRKWDLLPQGYEAVW